MRTKESSRKIDLQNRKILFCPHEINGQMQLMVEELRRRGYFATAASYAQDWLTFVNDIHLNLHLIHSSFRKQLQKTLFTLWAASNYDIFHFFWGASLFGLRCWPHLDLPLLRRMGKKVFVHFRGIDIVDIGYFDYLRSSTAGEKVEKPLLSRPDQLRSVKMWRRYSHRMLVSEPDLFRVVPEAVMVQQAINLDCWRPNREGPKSHEDGIIRIAHAPTSRRKKGTEFVERSVAEVKAMGHDIELVLVEKVPFHRVKELYELCDIGVDQILYGWHGKFSIEFMALGRPVICYIDPELLPYRSDMPIVNANPFSLTETLISLVQNAKLRHELGIRGQAYVKQHHDVARIIDQCLNIYEESFR